MKPSNNLEKTYAASMMELFVTKDGNSWELLLIVVIDSFVLNVIGLLRSNSEMHRQI